MNQKQVREIANARAWKDIRPFTIILTFGVAPAMMVLLFMTGDINYDLVGVLAIIIWLIIFRRTSNKHKARIIQNKEAQVLTKDDIKNISSDRAQGKSYWLGVVMGGLPVAIGVMEVDMPMNYRIMLITMGAVISVATIVATVWRGRKLRRKTIDEFKKTTDVEGENDGQ